MQTRPTAAWGVELPSGETFAYPATQAGWDDYLNANYSNVTTAGGFHAQGMPSTLRNTAKDKIVLT